MRLQDRWLALHTSDTVYEGFFGGGYSVIGNSLNDADLNDVQAPEAHFGFYNRIFGVQGRWVDEGLESGTGFDASIHLRILGGSMQNTNITLGYGLRDRNETFNALEQKYANQYAEALMNFYIFSFVGVKGTYRHLFANELGGITLSGNRLEGGLFIDISLFQLFLNYYIESLTFSESGVETNVGREGYTAGMRFYF